MSRRIELLIIFALEFSHFAISMFMDMYKVDKSRNADDWKETLTLIQIGNK